MATVTGSLKDFRPQPLGATAELIFTPTNPAGTPAKSLLVTKPVRVTPGSNGDFSVELVSVNSTNPRTPYHLRVQWQDSGGNITAIEDIPWLIAVTGDGHLVDFFTDVKPGRLITKGEKGDPGNVVQQAAIDELRAKDRTHSREIGELQNSSRSNTKRLNEHDRLIDDNAKVARSYTDAKTQAVINIMDTSNVDLDTDGAPFIHFGSMTVAVLQDTDGNPYYKARS